MLELGLSMTMFLMCLFGAMEFGRAVFVYNSLAFLAHQGARWAMVRGSASPTPATATTIQDYVQGMAYGVAPGRVAVTTVWTPNTSPGSQVKVTASFAFDFLGPYMPADFTMQSSSTVTILQ
jgi:Flp pilus assembly protein TadG